MNTKTLQVHGMHCASCASIITKKISKLSGVEHIDVNPGTEKAELYFDSQKISIEQINKTIEPLIDIIIGPTSFFFQFVGEIPMIERNVWGKSKLEAFIDYIVIKPDTFLVYLTGTIG